MTATSPLPMNAASDEAPGQGGVACAYCHLPVASAPAVHDEPVFCCLGCRWAAEITGQSGPEGSVHSTLARLGLAIFLSLNVMMFTMALWSQDLYDARAVGSGPLAASLADLFRYLCLLLSLPVLALLGGPLVDNALRLWRRDVAAADLLIALGVGAAYIYSAVSVFRGAGHVYFEVGCTVLVMITLGRWIEASGKLKTTAALDELDRLIPAEIRVVDSQYHDWPKATAQLAPGDRLHVLAGERVATDGIIERGQASLDEQMLTGESRPVARGPGDAVLGGSLNLDGDLIVRATASVQQGSLARLVEMVREARASRGRYQRLADRVSAWFLPAVILIALVTFSYHAWHSDFESGLMASLAVLLIACPCALGLATPMAVWTALGAASRAGVLFRSGEALEQLADIRAVRFDKTGTLTTGAPCVDQLYLASGTDPAEVHRRARRLAAASTHVFSQTIARYLADEQHAGAETSAAVCTSPGQGVSADFGDNASPTCLGSVRWLLGLGMIADAETASVIEAARRSARSVSAIGWDGRVRGVFVLSETLRGEARQALDACRAAGLQVAVLTGDDPARGRLLAEQLGVEVRAGLLPQDKVTALKAARQLFGPVAMVGDGINDAPALAASDLGIALGCGADVSRESAAICLIGDDLRHAAWAMQLAKRTVRTIRQNLFWSFFYNTLGIGLAATGLLNPAWAAIAMVVSSLFVVSNSLKLGRELAPAHVGGANQRPDDDSDVARRSTPDAPSRELAHAS